MVPGRLGWVGCRRLRLGSNVLLVPLPHGRRQHPGAAGARQEVGPRSCTVAPPGVAPAPPACEPVALGLEASALGLETSVKVPGNLGWDVPPQAHARTAVTARPSSRRKFVPQLRPRSTGSTASTERFPPRRRVGAGGAQTGPSPRTFRSMTVSCVTRNRHGPRGGFITDPRGGQAAL